MRDWLYRKIYPHLTIPILIALTMFIVVGVRLFQGKWANAIIFGVIGVAEVAMHFFDLHHKKRQAAFWKMMADWERDHASK